MKKHKLSVFLIKQEYTSIDQFCDSKGFNHSPISSNGVRIGVLAYKGGFKHTPPWVTIFQDVPNLDLSSIQTESAKGFLFIQHKERWFCFTFGHARHLIDDLAYEKNFGLIVTLNRCDPKSITSINKTTIGHVSLHSIEQATKEIELGSFEFDSNMNILRSATAKIHNTGKDSESETIAGRDSVTIHTAITIDKFPQIVAKLYDAFHEKHYEERYPWITKIQEERNLKNIDELDSILVQLINDKSWGKVWLAVPEITKWEEISHFTFRDTPTKHNGIRKITELNIQYWVEIIGNKKISSIGDIKKCKIFPHSHEGTPIGRWGAYQCLNAEIDYQSNKYILNNGSWYRIESNFVKSVNNFYCDIDHSCLEFPPHENKTEPEYIELVTQHNPSFILLDRKTVMTGGGRSRIEFCDLYTAKGDIIHIKKNGGSNLLSHLFYQGLVSGECFLHEEEFRKELNKHLPEEVKIIDTLKQPNPNEFKICFAIMCKSNKQSEIPFFSKVSLRHTALNLKRMGYKVSIKFIAP
ncbi:TIGR04141 family sporadically distributed protein [Chromobacterium violaceum]|uniref:TIGR04141 family sporadically distributed protein n=1 Tax=Chromobacterium violaceum TaxID=536 RepID=UPI001950F40E|nr:TIGR04141 family sporadically distributed protein [Chromobacterium violaceum]QRO32458.1 TIGR04141 family sporadically distributed protein [Chromobacterium violaceum]QRQ17741.1 TIGR04141 family sporadically distributed protein [Chromobacterium violaceum]